MLEQRKETVAELVGLNGGDAHTEVTVDFQDVLHELLEVGVFIESVPHM